MLIFMSKIYLSLVTTIELAQETFILFFRPVTKQKSDIFMK